MSTTSNAEDVDMRPEYDFSNGVRGKHYEAYQNKSLAPPAAGASMAGKASVGVPTLAGAAC